MPTPPPASEAAEAAEATSVRVFIRRHPAGLCADEPGFGGRQRGRPRRDRTLLHEAVSAFLSLPPTDVFISSLCPQCGSTEHGVPVANFHPHSDDAQSKEAQEAKEAKETKEAPILPVLSLSRCEDFVAVALTSSASIGIDIESVARVSQTNLDDVAFHPEEKFALDRLDPATGALHRTMLWTAKESLLKSAGTGLTVAPDLLWLQIVGTTVTLTEWPDVLGFSAAPAITMVPVGDQYACAVAHSPATTVTYSWWPSGEGSPSREQSPVIDVGLWAPASSVARSETVAKPH